MVKRALPLLFLLSTWVAPARASLVPVGVNFNINTSAVATLSGASATNPAQNGDLVSLAICIHTTTAAFTTPVGFTADGSTFTGAAAQCQHYHRVASSEPANFSSYSVSWTGATGSAGMQIYIWRSTQGTTPSVDSATPGKLNTTATTATIPSPTLSQGSEQQEFFAVAVGASFSSCDTGPYNTQTGNSWGGCIWGQSSTSILIHPTATAGGSAQWTGQTFSIEETVSNAAIVIGTSGSLGNASGNVNFTMSQQAVVADTAIAIIGSNNSSITINTPDLAYAGGTGVTGNSFVVPANAAANDIAIVCVSAVAPDSPPGDFHNICSSSPAFGAFECAYKVLVAGDLGATKTWTTGSFPGLVWNIIRPISGGSLSIDAASACGTGASASSAAAPSITTGSANELILSTVTQGGSNALTIPTGTRPGVLNSNGQGSATFFQASAGSTGSKTWNSNGSGSWGLSTVGIISTGSTGTGWTSAAQVSNPNLTPETIAAFYTTGVFGPFTFSGIGANSNISTITSVGHLASTAIDATSTLSTNTTSVFPYVIPQINPTANDELLLRAGYLSGASAVQSPPLGIVLIFAVNGGTAAFETVYDDLSFLGPQNLGGGTFGTNNVSLSLGLQSAVTPTRTTANQRVDQLGLITVAPHPPPPCVACGGSIGGSGEGWIFP